MLILGISGGLDLVDEMYFAPTPFFYHDAAAVLIEDGQVVAAIENERLDRIKHSNKFPVKAIRFCLDEHGASIEDVDRIAYYWNKISSEYEQMDRFIEYLQPRPYRSAHSLLADALEQAFGVDVSNRVAFVNHHIAHAISAAAFSGLDEPLVCSLDGRGDSGSGLIATFRGGHLSILREIPNPSSLGQFYVKSIGLIGYRQFDEYKVMGLAPYGDPNHFREVMSRSYELRPEGKFRIQFPPASGDDLPRLIDQLARAPGEPFGQIHKDWAAALQYALEDIVLHILRHFQVVTGLKSLTLVGGVAHNCTMNGKILTSGIFDRVFVQPASHDAGAALGAALQTYYQMSGEPIRTSKLDNVYWGTDIGLEEQVLRDVRPWRSLVDFSREEDIINITSRLLADGAAVGWVQGRSEFGPRALGNRSILADPRPAANKDRINQMIKKREAYRPFAPTVLEEHVDEYFVVPENRKAFPFMVFVVEVQPGKRELLGAITHVDGTARIQTVSQHQNSRYWALISAFAERTGIPILLNTSFNNNVEPIVDSVEDAIVCFLTTGLDYLVIGNFLIKKKGPLTEDRLADLIPSLPPYVRLATSTYPADANGDTEFRLQTTFDERKDVVVSLRVFRLLEQVDSQRKLGDLLVNSDNQEASRTDCGCHEDLLESIVELWSKRLVNLKPAGLSTRQLETR